MKLGKIFLALSAAVALSACTDAGPDKSVDRNIIDQKHLSQLQAGIWVDPNGCDHWIIDDGVEGYLSARTDPYGKPVCSGVAPPTYTTGNFKGGSSVPDPI